MAITKELRVDKKYFVKELSTLDNYVLSNEIQKVVLEPGEIKTLTFENELKKGQIKIVKVDKDNNEIHLSGVEFQILDEDNNIVDTIITGENGITVSKELRIDKKYFIKEFSTLQNYVLSEEIKQIVLEQDKITDIIFENEKIKGYIEITKLSEDDNHITGEKKGTLLKDAVFEIMNDNSDIIATVKTLDNGKILTPLLEYGDYYIKEKSSGSDNYLLNNEVYKVEIRENLQVIPIEITNQSVRIGLDIDKNGIIQSQANDEIKYGFNSLKNTSNVSLDNFTWMDNLPYEFIRITKLFTGTYNENLDYIVKYKTNKTEDYIELGKFNTQKNNYIDFENVELAEGEYITDFKMEFGTVMPGFEAIEKPFIFSKVLSTVKFDDKWTNYTTLTGNYKENKLEDKAEWNTISYAKEFKINKLPKTGF